MIKQKHIANIEKVKSLTIVDDSSYVPEKSHNGGCYRFRADYWREAPQEDFMVEYSTSAEFEYCPVYGLFRSCDSCFEHGDGCNAEYERISEGTLAEILEGLGEDEYIEDVEYFEEVGK